MSYISKSAAPSSTSRRALLVGAAVTAGVTLGAPFALRAQTRQLVVGGAASHKPWMDSVLIPFFEKKYSCKIIYEGTRSLVNLEKMQRSKGKQYLSVVQMDDPVMILAVQEGLLEPLTVKAVPNLAKIRPDAIHLDGMWANYVQPWQGIAYNTKALPMGVSSWAELWEPRFKGRVILPSLQNTEGIANLFMAAQLQTGKSPAEAQKDASAGFAKLVALKPNLLTIYTQMPQAFNLLEQGEAWVIAGALSSFALVRKAEGAPIDLAAPKEGIFASPSGVCAVKGAPNADLAFAYINELLGSEIQSRLVGPTYSLPTNVDAPAPAGMPKGVQVISTDWSNVAKNRSDWVKRWDRDMAI